MQMTLGNCPVVDLASNICLLGGQEVACNIIRECDGQTGAQHFEYAMPFGNPNANIWVMQPDGSFAWSGPDAPTGPPPTPPPAYVPAFAEGPNYYQTPVVPYQPAVPVDPPAPAQPATPAAQPVQAAAEAPPPPGTFTFDPQPAVIQPSLGPAPASGTPAGPAEGNTGTFLDLLTGGNSPIGTLKQTVGQTGLPLWVLLAAAGGAAYFLFGDKR